MIYPAKKILDLIGHTPIVKFYKKNNINFFLKLEGMNPSGSIKDITALSMIKDAENKGLLKKGSTIIESTSGNTGIALAMIGAIKGYKVKLVMPENVSLERKRILKAYGANLIFTPANYGSDGAILMVRKIIKENPSFVYLNQYDNDANWKGHYKITGNEILHQVKNITHFIAGVGTGGTITGVAKKLKEYDNNIKIIGIEPDKNSDIPGLKNIKKSIKPKIYNKSLVDEIIYVNEKQARGIINWLAKKKGILGGLSTGASVYGAFQIAKKLKKGNIVIISPDSGFKYLSMKVFM